MKINYKLQPILFFVVLLALLSSCGGVKYSQLLMLEEVSTESIGLDTLPYLTIRDDDILNIRVTSRNPETVAAFYQYRLNTYNNSATGPNALGTQDGYRVDEEGNIYLPFLGQVQAAGKNLIDLRAEISEDLKQYIPDASVQVRFMNFRVTLLGEVVRPNTYIIPNERLTILEAIGMAGDFTSYARRDSILIIRERNEVREFSRINIQDKSVFESPFFYLSPNDIVYVEPLKAKQYATQGDFIQRYSIVLVPMISFLTFLLGAAIVNN